MVAFYGDYDTTETVVIPFNTFSSDDPSASVTITNLVSTDVYIYKDGSLTQRTSFSGIAVDVDVDAIVGNHWATIDLSDNTDAGFYANGSRYQARMEGTTVDGATINAWIGSFSIGCTLRPTTAGRKLDVTATGAAGVDWANVENPTTAVDLSATDIQLADTVTTLTGHTVQTGDSFARLGAPTGASIAADLVTIAGALVTIDNVVDDLEGRLTAVRAGYLDKLAAANIPADIDTLLTRITAAVALASVCTEARLAELDAANLPTTTDNTITNIAALNDLSAANVKSEVDDVISTDANTELASVPTTTSDLRKMIQYIFEYFRNKRTITATTETLMKEDASTTLGTSTLSDDGTTFSKGEMN